MTQFLLDKLVEEAQQSIKEEEDNKRKIRNRRKAARQASRPQGRGRKKKG